VGRRAPQIEDIIIEFQKAPLLHEFRPLSASDIRQLLERHWTPPGVKPPGVAIDKVAAASIIRITGGQLPAAESP
jgi:hypothetical protein